MNQFLSAPRTRSRFKGKRVAIDRGTKTRCGCALSFSAHTTPLCMFGLLSIYIKPNEGLSVECLHIHDGALSIHNTSWIVVTLPLVVQMLGLPLQTRRESSGFR
jgi:hypothetical protein